MLRHVNLSNRPWTALCYRAFAQRYRALSSRTQDDSVDEEEVSAARRWLANLNADTVPRSICDVSFSRSSGPGGQNVNKYAIPSLPIDVHCFDILLPRVNSKATLRLPRSSLQPLVPALLWSSIQASRYWAENSDSIVIQADDSRKQNDNVNSCFVKLHSILVQAGRDTVPGETSSGQAARVKRLCVLHQHVFLIAI